MRRAAPLALVALVALRALGAEEPAAVRVTATVTPAEAAVGDRLELTLAVDAPAGSLLDPAALGPELGPFTVLGGSWSAPEPAAAGRQVARFVGSIAAYRTGALRLPAVTIEGRDAAGRPFRAASEPQAVTITTRLDPAAAQREELADLKPPATVPADHGPLVRALAILGLLLVVALLLWWLHRRYAERLAAVPAPSDPFQRQPPHVWVYAVLQQLLDRRLPEQGQVDLFFEELARIVKTYLGGRFRVDLLERTTSEVPATLAGAGAAEPDIAAVRALLERADAVKFAGAAVDAGGCRLAVEDAYRVVDATKPREAEASAAERGAA